jgi:hypothetical protein
VINLSQNDEFASASASVTMRGLFCNMAKDSVYKAIMVLEDSSSVSVLHSECSTSDATPATEVVVHARASKIRSISNIVDNCDGEAASGSQAKRPRIVSLGKQLNNCNVPPSEENASNNDSASSIPALHALARFARHASYAGAAANSRRGYACLGRHGHGCRASRDCGNSSCN